MPVYDLNAESKGESSPTLWKMIQKTKSPTKPGWQKTFALKSTATSSQPTLTPKHKSQHLPAFDYSQVDNICCRKK